MISVCGTDFFFSHDGGVIYIGSNDDNLYALSAKNGSLLWKYTTGDWVYGR